MGMTFCAEKCKHRPRHRTEAMVTHYTANLNLTIRYLIINPLVSFNTTKEFKSDRWNRKNSLKINSSEIRMLIEHYNKLRDIYFTMYAV
jgi:hypothetical protein